MYMSAMIHHPFGLFNSVFINVFIGDGCRVEFTRNAVLNVGILALDQHDCVFILY
jgi:hypothetical protein